MRTIDWLVAQPHGPIGKHTPRIAPFETTVFKVKSVTLVEAKKETDRDIHLVIRDDHPPPTHQMIVEFPDVACGVERFRSLIGNARAAVEAYMAQCGHVADNGWTQLMGWATIRGVGFL